jgi:hypothetical protein
MPLGYVLVNSRSDIKTTIRRKRQHRLSIPIQPFIAIGIMAAGVGFVGYFSGFYPREIHRETIKEAQWREYNNAKEKEMNEALEADMRAWHKSRELLPEAKK